MFWNRNQSASSQKPIILIIEDDPNNHLLFYSAFSTVGFEVKIRQTADGDFVDDVISAMPDIISMDIMMGANGGEVEREGLEAAELLKSDERTNHIPIIMLTNFNDEQKISRAKELGVVDFIGLQSREIKNIPLIFKRYLDDPEHYLPSHPLMRT